MSKNEQNNNLQDETEKLGDVESVAEDVAAESGEEARDLEKELASAQEEVDDLRDKMLRVAADYENFKKRMERQRLTDLKYAGEQILREILPVVDNLERALEQGGSDEGDAGGSLEALLEGVRLTHKSLVNTLEKFEVKPIESVGQLFDPNHHEALTMEASDSVPANHIVTEFQRGYYYKDRLLRAAKVIVSSGEAKE